VHCKTERRKNNMIAKGKASKKKTGKHSGDVQGERTWK
jgi:hypothetical protein